MEIRGTGAMRGLGGGILGLPGAECAPGDVQVRGAPERGQRWLWNTGQRNKSDADIAAIKKKEIESRGQKPREKIHGRRVEKVTLRATQDREACMQRRRRVIKQLRPDLKDSPAAPLSEEEQFEILEEVCKREGVGPPLAWDATSMSGQKWNIESPEREARLRERLGLTDVRPLEYFPEPTPGAAPATKRRRRTTVAKPAAKKAKPTKKAKKSKKKRFENGDYSKQYTTKRRRTETTAASP